jgi:FKBP-type peptidyl-prolyl cis-trans isomerase SlyD
MTTESTNPGQSPSIAKAQSIAKDSVVAFHYTLTDADGKTVESSRDSEATVYLHGANNILPAMEKAFEGKTVGDTFELTLTPADAYGERSENALQRVPAKYLTHEGKLKAGQIVSLHLKDGGSQPVTVIKVGKFSVDIDGNHPLAGMTLNFAIEVVDVRDASAEEKEHGHAHGAGGHHH